MAFLPDTERGFVEGIAEEHLELFFNNRSFLVRLFEKAPNLSTTIVNDKTLVQKIGEFELMQPQAENISGCTLWMFKDRQYGRGTCAISKLDKPGERQFLSDVEEVAEYAHSTGIHIYIGCPK